MQFQPMFRSKIYNFQVTFFHVLPKRVQPSIFYIVLFTHTIT